MTLTESPFRVVGLGTFVPQSYDQFDLLTQAGHSENAFARGICEHGKIDTRSFCEPISTFTFERDNHAARFEYFRKYGPGMALQALRRAAAGDGREFDLAQLGAVIVVNSTGFIMPAIPEILGVEHGIGKRDALRYNLSGHGCFGAIPAIELARSLIHVGRVQTAAVVCTEPTSCVFSATPQNKSEVVPHLLFGEGAAALLFSGSDEASNSALPCLLDSQTQLGSGSLDFVGVTLTTDWGSYVGPKVPEGGVAILPVAIDRLLSRNRLSLPDIAHWVFHTGGRRVLEGCQQALGLSDRQMEANFEILRRYGNMQSGTVLFSLQETIRRNSPRPGDLGVLIGIGPGMTVAAFLLQWP